MEKIATRKEKYKTLREEIAKLPDDYNKDAKTIRSEKIDEIADDDQLDPTLKKSVTKTTLSFDKIMDVHGTYDDADEYVEKDNAFEKSKRRERARIIIISCVIIIAIIALVLFGIWAWGGIK